MAMSPHADEVAEVLHSALESTGATHPTCGAPRPREAIYQIRGRVTLAMVATGPCA